MRAGLFAGALVALALLAAAAACGGGSSQDELFPESITLGEGELFPQITNSSLAVGENRFSLGLLDKENAPVPGAEVGLAFYDLNGNEPVLKSQAKARFVPVELSFIDEGSGKEKRVVGDSGVYVAQVNYYRPGRWGVRISVTRDGRHFEPIPFRFDVQERTPEPAVGDAAPPSRQLTLADVADVSQIDSSYPPRPHMHGVTVADALATGRPLVIAFATPAFCESRTCGPVMDTVMDPLYERYGDRAAFIHVEPYKLKELREGTAQIPVEAATEWGLQSEPWVFVVGSDGKIVAKFEGIVALDEVESALGKVLAAGP